MLDIVKLDGMGRYMSHTISDTENGMEVLQLMKGLFGLSSRKIKSVKYAEHGIWLDGIRVNVRQRVKTGQSLMILLDDVTPSCEAILDYDFKLKVIYEDEDLLFIDKPSGEVCHPSQGHYADSIVNAVCAYLRDRGEQSSIHLLGRLDKDTSGIVGFAKNSVVQERMERQREQGLFKKQYMALVCGHLAYREGMFDMPLKETWTEDGKHTYMISCYDGTGKASHTDYEVLEECEEFSLCRVTIRTGRTHQIRAHMASAGHPLVGDALYNGSSYLGLDRAALHAATVSFVHPFTEQRIELSAAIPEDFARVLEAYKTK